MNGEWTTVKTNDPALARAWIDQQRARTVASNAAPQPRYTAREAALVLLSAGVALALVIAALALLLWVVAG